MNNQIISEERVSKLEARMEALLARYQMLNQQLEHALKTMNNLNGYFEDEQSEEEISAFINRDQYDDCPF